MNAMNKRDTVLKSVVESRDKTKEALHETQLIQKSTQLDYSQLLEKYQRSQQELESQKKLLNQYHSQVNNLQSQLATAEENAKKSYEQKEELKQLLTKEEQISLNHKEKFAQTSILLDEARKKLKTKETINEQCVNAIVDCKLESKISEVVSKNKEQLKTFQDQLHSNAQLSNQLASLNLKYNELQEIHAGREKEFELLVSKHQETLQQLEKLISENQSLTYSLDKKEIELSTFKYRHQPKDTTELELSISSLEQNLKSAKKEKDDMVHNWLKLQQANTTLKKEVQRLTLENDFLQTQRTVHYTSQGMVNNEIKEMKKDSFEVNMQMTKLHVELERIRPRIKELEERNKMLETQLVNREYTSQDSQNHFGDMMHLLKSEIHRVTNDKLHLQKDQLQNGKSYCVLEQKYILKKELLEKLKKEKIGLLKQNQLFKFKIDMLTKKVKELKQDWKHLNELGVNHYNRQKDTMQKKIEGSFTEDYQVVDLPALKLRIETLTLENKHLLSQVDLAKSQAMTAEKKQLSLEKQIGSLNMQLHTLEKEASSLQSSFQDMAQRADWAEKICAFMESQFKEFAPNRKLDFSYLRNSVSEPSASLLSAFHSRSTYSTSLEELPPLKSSKKIEFIQQT
ncbi:hypothetical protein HMI55_003002 [Coelomomyces lativittatus]|nr:hypothetical protein HMI55_003002 [Coelomomyces lativittatus]